MSPTRGIKRTMVQENDGWLTTVDNGLKMMQMRQETKKRSSTRSTTHSRFSQNSFRPSKTRILRCLDDDQPKILGFLKTSNKTNKEDICDETTREELEICSNIETSMFTFIAPKCTITSLEKDQQQTQDGMGLDKGPNVSKKLKTEHISPRKSDNSKDNQGISQDSDDLQLESQGCLQPFIPLEIDTEFTLNSVDDKVPEDKQTVVEISDQEESQKEATQGSDEFDLDSQGSFRPFVPLDTDGLTPLDLPSSLN